MVAIIPIRERTTPIMVSTVNVAYIGDGIQSSNLEQISWITDESQVHVFPMYSSNCNVFIYDIAMCIVYNHLFNHNPDNSPPFKTTPTFVGKKFLSF